MNLEELANLFLDEEAYIEEIRKPVLLTKHTAYTDSNSVLYIPLNGEYVGIQSKVAIKLNSLLSVVEVENTIKVSDLEKAILFYQKSEKRKYAECLSCNGSGNIDIDFTFKGKSYKSIEIECPECDGIGQGALISRKMEYQGRNDSIDFNGTYLHANFIERLILVAKYNNQKEIKMLTNPHPTNPVLFKCKDMFVIIMPMINQQEQKPFVKIY
jgi:excinuclease UvrABC ATPase subunit